MFYRANSTLLVLIRGKVQREFYCGAATGFGNDILMKVTIKCKSRWKLYSVKDLKAVNLKHKLATSHLISLCMVIESCFLVRER